MRWFALLLVLLLPVSAIAQSLPALYDVANVEPDDVLNIRIAPDASSPVMGELPHNEVDIEVISFDASGKWGQVNVGERAGWVAMRFMDRTLAPGNSLLPRPLICFGTEPFWKLDINSGPIAELGLFDEPSRRMLGLWILSSVNRDGRYAVLAEGRGTQMTAFVQRRLCSDGMSDRVYGLDMDLVVRSKEHTKIFSGCCSLIP